MAKKKNKRIVRPWCWYCEREFEDQKVLMQHQKAKHFKCNMCPRRLNTAGGLAVHIQQVHKLEPENLPRIENALPGRDGYEVEIFGMEGIPAPDIADYKRRKEIELGLAAGSISQPPPKRAKVENRPLSEEELRRQLEEHKALMGHGSSESSTVAESSSSAVYGAAPQTYASPPVPVNQGMPPMPGEMPPIPGGMPPMPGAMPPMPGGMPPMPPPGFFAPGVPPSSLPGGPPPFPPFMPGFPPGPPGFPLPPGFPPAGPPPFPPSSQGRPPFAVPPFMPSGASPNSGGFPIPPMQGMGSPPAPPPQFVPAQITSNSLPMLPPAALPQSQSQTPPIQHQSTEVKGHIDPPRKEEQVRQPVLTLPNPSLAQTNAEFKKPTVLKVKDANFSPDEHRAIHVKYFCSEPGDRPSAPVEEPRGKKRARAEDFL